MTKKLFVILIAIFFMNLVMCSSFVLAETELEKEKRRQEAFQNILAGLAIVATIYLIVHMDDKFQFEESKYLPEMVFDFESKCNHQEFSILDDKEVIPTLKFIWRF